MYKNRNKITKISHWLGVVGRHCLSTRFLANKNWYKSIQQQNKLFESSVEHYVFGMSATLQAKKVCKNCYTKLEQKTITTIGCVFNGRVVVLFGISVIRHYCTCDRTEYHTTVD